jgi:hypothetical protein
MAENSSVEVWLQPEKHLRIIRAIAKELAAELGSAADTMGHEAVDIENDLVVFICENPIRLRKLVTGAHDGEDLEVERRLKSAIKKAYGRRMLDQERLKSVNPYRYFHKRAGDVFRRGFHSSTDSRGFAVFSLYPENEGIRSIPEQDIAELVSPFERIPGLELRNATTEKMILATGTVFWEEASKFFGGGRHWVPVRDFSRWAGRHLQLSAPRPVQPKKNKEGKFRELIEAVPDETTPLRWDAAKVGLWARCFLGQMGDSEQGIFHYLYCLKMKLEEAAARLGYQSASGLDYPKKKLIEKLRFYLRDKDWLSVEDGDDEAQEYFRNVLCAGLKNAFVEP